MDRYLVLVHVVCTLLSYVAFLVAFLSGVLFLIQEKQLKAKKMGALFYSLPPLEKVDRINLLSISYGFALLTIGVMCGIIGIRLHFGEWWTGDPKEYLAVGLWGWYCVLWWVRMRSTLRGRRVALLSILGFSFLIFAFIGAQMIFSSGHPFYSSKTGSVSMEHAGSKTV